MKRKILFTLLSACFACCLLPAQEKPAFVVSGLFNEDLDWVLEDLRIYTHQVDLQPVKGKNYNLIIYIDEHHKKDSVRNIRTLPVKTQKKFSDGSVTQAERMRTMFKFPTDSTALITVSIPGFMVFPAPVALKPVDNRYLYHTRPFAVDEFAIGKKIPVILYGSFWKDEKFDIFRFCGLKELPPAMDDDMFDLMPHYFIVSLKVEEIPETK